MSRFPVLVPRYTFTTLLAAEYLGVTPDTIRGWRLRGGGPPFVRVGPKLCRYAREDLDAYVEARRVAPTEGK